MGKSLIIKGADFSDNALVRVGYVYEETVGFTSGVAKDINCSLKAGRKYAVYIDGKPAVCNLSISQNGTVLSSFRTNNISAIKSNNTGTIITAASNGKISITTNSTVEYTIHVEEAFLVEDKTVIPGSRVNVAQLEKDKKYFIALSNLQLKESATSDQFIIYLKYNNTNYGVIQGTTDVGGYYINTAVDGTLQEMDGVNVSDLDSYKVSIYTLLEA